MSSTPKAQHTPGPWSVEVDRFPRKRGPVRNVLVVADAGGMPGIAVSCGTVEPRDLANARLIAAAPDLLYWLTTAREALRDAGNYTGLCEDIDVVLAKVSGNA